MQLEARVGAVRARVRVVQVMVGKEARVIEVPARVGKVQQERVGMVQQEARVIEVPVRVGEIQQERLGVVQQEARVGEVQVRVEVATETHSGTQRNRFVEKKSAIGLVFCIHQMLSYGKSQYSCTCQKILTKYCFAIFYCRFLSVLVPDWVIHRPCLR